MIRLDALQDDTKVSTRMDKLTTITLWDCDEFWGEDEEPSKQQEPVSNGCTGHPLWQHPVQPDGIAGSMIGKGSTSLKEPHPRPNRSHKKEDSKLSIGTSPMKSSEDIINKDPRIPLKISLTRRSGDRSQSSSLDHVEHDPEPIPEGISSAQVANSKAREESPERIASIFETIKAKAAEYEISKTFIIFSTNQASSDTGKLETKKTLLQTILMPP